MARIQVATDNFNRADAPGLGANWGDVGPFSSSSGKMRIHASTQVFAGGGGDSAARWVGAGTFTNDQYSSLKVQGTGTDFSYVGVIARASADQDAAGDYYMYQMQGIFGNTALIKRVNGTETTIDNTPSTLTWNDGDAIEIECSGTSISGLQTGVVKHSATDSALTTGNPGVFGSHVSEVAPFGDDWEGGNLGVGAIVPGAASLTLTGKQVGVIQFGIIIPGTGSLAFTGRSPIINGQANLIPGAGSLVLTGRQPTAIVPVLITPAAVALILTGKQAGVSASSGNGSAVPGAAALSLTGFQPIQELGVPSPLVGSLTLTGYQPLDSTGIGRVPSAGSLTLSGNQPGQIFSFVRVAANGQLVLTGFPVGVSSPSGVSMSPGTATLSITGKTPDVVVVLASPTVTPNVGSLQLLGYTTALKIEVVTPVSLAPGVATLTLTGRQASRSIANPSAQEGQYKTTFLGDASPVPPNAQFLGGAAFAADTGERYVCYWPADNKVVFLGGFAHRHDGAMVIDPGGAITGKIQGLALTFRGELVTTLNARELDHNGFPLLQTGQLCVTNQS